MSGKRQRETPPEAAAGSAEAAKAAERRDAAGAPETPAEPAPEAAVAAPAVEVLALTERLAALSGEQDRLLRLLAERENQVKRMERDQERERLRLQGELVGALLPLADDLERALGLLEAEAAAHAEGLRLIAQRLEALLAAFGLEPIAALGERFDPRLHEALVQLPATEAEKGTVIQELQRGYRLGERVIRPAKVAVAG
ncbi:nucleotide exchange factor GrpE [bacterium]|nr:nucleotide exchange factor GrpE [bacterium]